MAYNYPFGSDETDKTHFVREEKYRRPITNFNNNKVNLHSSCLKYLCCRAGNSPSSGAELCLRLSSDQWVIGRKVDSRQVYLVVAMKNSQLTEVMEVANKVISVEFRNVSLLEK